MRQSYNDSLDNAITKMNNANRDYIDQEINRLASVDARDTNYRRSGMLNFGARQMVNMIGDFNFATIGASMFSTTVGH